MVGATLIVTRSVPRCSLFGNVDVFTGFSKQEGARHCTMIPGGYVYIVREAEPRWTRAMADPHNVEVTLGHDFSFTFVSLNFSQ